MKIKFEVILETGDAEHVKALNTFMKAVSDEPTVREEEAPEPEPEPEPEPKKGKLKEKKEKEKEPEVEEITVKDIRALLSKKVEDHREEIKEKLTELGAKNVSSLDEENYEEFVDFLNDLD